MSTFSPVFLIGFPRSGTTLLNRILSAHPDISVLDEKPTTTDLLHELDAVTGNAGNLFQPLSGEERSDLIANYLERIDDCGGDRNAPVVIDKMPLNVVNAAQLSHVFPQAKFIFALRHPCDAVLSCFMQHFAPNDAMSNFYTLKDAAKLYDAVMSLWVKYEEHFPLRTHYVKYEVLVSNIEAAIRPLLEFLELQWENEILDYSMHSRSEPVATPSYRQISEPVHNKSVYRWRNYESVMSSQIKMLAPWVKHFGYGEPA